MAFQIFAFSALYALGQIKDIILYIYIYVYQRLCCLYYLILFSQFRESV